MMEISITLAALAVGVLFATMHHSSYYNNKQTDKIMDEHKQYFIAQEDTTIYNVFDYDEFDDDGYLDGHANEEGYHIDDFDIVAEFDTLDEANEWLDDVNGYYNESIN